MPVRAFVFYLVILMCASRSWAWGTKEHVLLARMAIRQLLDDPATPEPMKAWLKAGAPALAERERDKEIFFRERMGLIPRGVNGLPYWSAMPDLDPSRDKVEPFGVPERMLHFVDLEYFTPATKPAYADDLSARPAADAIPKLMTDPRWAQAGMLPFRVEDCYRKLVRCLRDGRLNDAPRQYPRDEHAVRWAGYLAHYLADNTQPQHATTDYKSASYLNGKSPLKGPDIHSALEWMMADDEFNDHAELRREYWDALHKALESFKNPTPTQDIWRDSLEVSMASYSALPLIGRAAQAATTTGRVDLETFFRFKGQYAGREMSVLEMKAHQQAWAIKRIAMLWRQAWDEARAPATNTVGQP